jgi:hypothetical protein
MGRKRLVGGASMSRTKLFVSYSHRDHDWLERLRLHLAVLERQGLIHVWSDTRIELGADWEEEIEGALSESRVAVLLVSPAFLASAYIWEKEMPHIIEHKKQCMEVWPLVIRPCAWRLEENLAKLQARPAEGRALSTESEAQADLDLTRFVYEIAARIEKFSGELATQEMELAEQYRARPSQQSTGADRGYESLRISDSGISSAVPTDLLGEALVTQPQSWTGRYSDYITLRLTIQNQQDRDFQGSIRYLNTDTVTAVEGRFEEDSQQIVADLQPIIDGTNVREAQLALRFRETGYEIEGTQRISFAGEYRALMMGNSIVGAWFGEDGHLAADLYLTRDD